MAIGGVIILLMALFLFWLVRRHTRGKAS
jgi:hypothetical protein